MSLALIVWSWSYDGSWLQEKQRKSRSRKSPAKKATAKTTPKRKSAPAKTPQEATTTESVNKTKFILAQPESLSAQQVVDASAAQGITVRAKQVYNARAAAKKRRSASTPEAAKGATGEAVAGTSRGASKSAFIRSLPDLPVAEVIQKAAEAGMKISAGLVYSVRTAQKKKKKKGTADGAKTPGKQRGRPPTTATTAAPTVSVSVAGDRERQLIQLALDIGLARAVELIADFRTKAAALL